MVTWHQAISLHCQLILACRHVRCPPIHYPTASLRPRLSAAKEISEHTGQRQTAYTSSNPARERAPLHTGPQRHKSDNNGQKSAQNGFLLQQKCVRKNRTDLKRTRVVLKQIKTPAPSQHVYFLLFTTCIYQIYFFPHPEKFKNIYFLKMVKNNRRGTYELFISLKQL